MPEQFGELQWTKSRYFGFHEKHLGNISQINYMQTENSSIDFLGKVKRSLKRQWKPAGIAFVGIIAVTALMTFIRKPVYNAEGKLLFRREATTPVLTGLGKDVTALSSLREQVSPVDTEVELIRTHEIASKTLALLDLKDSKGKPVSLEPFTKKLKITATKGTDLIQITYEDSDPIIAANVVNTLMKVYLDFAVERYRLIASNALQFIDQEIPSAEEKVKKAERELSYFREKNNVVSLDEEQRSSVLFIFNLKNELKTVQTQLADTETQFQTLKNRVKLEPDQVLSMTNIMQSKGVQDTLAEKQKLESQLVIESTRYQSSHPVIQALQSQLNAVNKLLRERVDLVQTNQIEGLVGNSQQTTSLQKELATQLVQLDIKYTGLVSQLRSLLDAEKQSKQRIDSLPKIEQLQRELLRNLNAAQLTYTNLRTKADELRIAENQNTVNATILSKAIPPKEPAGSTKTVSMMAGVLFGGLVAIATAIFLNSKDRSIQTLEDAIQAFKFPLIGEIPLAQQGHNVLAIADGNNLPPINEYKTEKEQKFLIRDASQLLGLNLKVLNLKKSIKVIIVTSVEAEEGKSTIAAYLAASLAQLGEKVVLVDANLHTPTQHHLWCFDNHLGLSDILLNSADLDLAIVESMPNLSLLASGKTSASYPLAILDTSKMESIIHNLASKYDYVIIDTPAIRSNPDALFLSKFSDGILLVIRPNVSTLDSAAYLRKIIEQAGQTIFGQVINGVKVTAKID